MKTFKTFAEDINKPVTMSGGGKTITAKPGSKMTFTHHETGKPATGVFKKKVNRGGRQYAHVEMPDKTAMHVPIHHINEAIEENTRNHPKSPTGMGHSADAHFNTQSKKMQDAINLHLRNGKDYPEAVKAAKVHVKEESVDEALGTIKNMKAASKFNSSNVSNMIRGEKQRLSDKQKKIASVAGDPGKIDAEDFAKLRSMKKEETEMRHSSDSLGDHMALKAYANKRGGIDKHDLLTAASHMAFGNMDHLKKHLKALDTDVRDKALEYVARRHHAELGYRVHKEEVELDEAIKLGSKVRIHNPGKRNHGEEGTVGEIHRGLPGVRPKYYTVDHGGTSSQLPKENLRIVKEEADHINEANSHREVDNLKSKGKHHEAGQHAAKSGHDRQYGPHFGMRSDKEEAQRQFFKGYDSVKKTNEEADLDEALGTIKNMKAASKFDSSNVSDMIRGEKARKAGMAKVSTTKDIGYKVVDVGPGQKETVRKMHNFKEEEDQINEISSDTLISYSQKAHNQIKGNQPADPDKLRKRTNREQGIKLAFNKHYQVRTKVPATIKEEEIDEAESGLSTKTLAGYSIKASDASKHRKLPTSKVDNRYAGVSKVDKILAARDKKKVD